uniref:Methyltransferase domain-containing protein n=1 Tax=Odontella aurita TaxID=265563 RepID=A0A7S4MTJ5_9STRA|mmetsp:Transcript_31712/g.94894  ORF Transcript_31712/g.94894 Transcript_31712/m.94894 type:complete len:376 (+) Transcript_31712:104-1231(+)
MAAARFKKLSSVAAIVHTLPTALATCPPNRRQIRPLASGKIGNMLQPSTPDLRAGSAQSLPADCDPSSSSSAASTSSSSSDLLARSWTAAASGYDEMFVPRFGPWTEDALSALRRALDGEEGPPPPSRRIVGGYKRALVACCGPGQELLPVAEIVGPGSEVTGVDISPGMVRIARGRIAATESERGAASGAEGGALRAASSIDAKVGDAMRPPPGPYCAIFSVFGLQQLPNPIQALKTWANELCPSGVAVVAYWPPGKVEDHGPWARWGDLIRRQSGKLPPPSEGSVWDENVADALKAAGMDMLEDCFVLHRIQWDNPAHFWEGMTQFGPWHAARLKKGDKFVDGLRDKFCSAFKPNSPIIHSPRARMLVFRKPL